MRATQPEGQRRSFGIHERVARLRSKRWLILTPGVLLFSMITWAFVMRRPPGLPLRIQQPASAAIGLRADLEPGRRITAYVPGSDLPKLVRMYSEITGREAWPDRRPLLARLDEWSGARLTKWRWIRPLPPRDAGINVHADGRFTATEIKQELELAFRSKGLEPAPVGTKYFALKTLRVPRDDL